jgi:hypothetical protein
MVGTEAAVSSDRAPVAPEPARRGRDRPVSVRLIDASEVTLRPDRHRSGAILGYELVVRHAGGTTERRLGAADAEAMLWQQLRRPTRVARACVDGFDLWRYREAWYAVPADATTGAVLDAIAAIDSTSCPRIYEIDRPAAEPGPEEPARPPGPRRAVRGLRSGCFALGDRFELIAEDGATAAWMEPAADGETVMLRTGDGGEWRISRVTPGWSYEASSLSGHERGASFDASSFRNGGQMTLRPSRRTLRLGFYLTRWRLVESRWTVLAVFSRPDRRGPLFFDVTAAFAQSADVELALPFALLMATTFEANAPMPER